MRRRLIATLGMVLLAIAWVSPASVAYLCAMDGQQHAKCCCAPDGADVVPRDTEVQREECCEVRRTATHPSPAITAAADHDHPTVALVAFAAVEAAGPSSTTDVVPRLARGPPRAVGPPAYLRHCRFLI